MKKYLVFDIGGTNLKYALIDEKNNLHYKGLKPTVSEDLPSFLDEIYNICNRYRKKYSGIAISCPGKVDVQNKIIYHGGALPFLDGLNIQEKIGQRYHVPVGVENDGKCAALAEQQYGVLRKTENGAVLVLGTGVGGGIIINHHLLHGSHYQAGEVSFVKMQIGQNESKYNFGFIGSATEMIKKINQACGHSNLTDGLAAFKSINDHDLSATRIFEDYCQNIAYLIVNIQAIVDLEKIAIGGGISAQPVVVETIRRKYQAIYNEDQQLKATLTPPIIERTHFGNEANLYGALAALLNKS